MVRIERGSKKLIVRKRVRRVQGQLGEVEGGPEMGNREALGGGASFAKEREKKKRRRCLSTGGGRRDGLTSGGLGRDENGEEEPSTF